MRAFLTMFPKPLTVSLAPAALLAGCTAIDEDVAMPGEPASATICPDETRGWTVWINAMPGAQGADAQRALHVTGEVMVPAGAVPTLTAGPTDRMMPPSQRFVLALASQPGAPGGWQQVRADVTPALPEYRAVMIGCDGTAIANVTDIQTAQ